jgi:cell division protein FtsB
MDLRLIYREKLLPFARRYSRELILLLFALLVVHDIFGHHGLIAMRQSQKQAKQIRQEIQRLDDENRELQEKVKALKTDPRAIERIARDDLGLAKPGELIFKLPQPNPIDSAIPVQNPLNPPKK